MKNWKKLLALLLAVVMLLSLTACGMDAGTDVTGKYLCIAIAEDGVNFTAPENDGQYEKGRLAAMYTLYAMEVAGERYDYDALVEMDVMDGSFLRIDYDAAKGYTGELSFEGEEPDTFTLEDELGMLNFASGDQMGFYEDAPGVIGITHADLGGTIFFALESVERSAAAADPLVDWWKATGTAGGSCTAARANTKIWRARTGTARRTLKSTLLHTPARWRCGTTSSIRIWAASAWSMCP